MKARTLPALAIFLATACANAHSLCSDSLLSLSESVKVGRNARLTGRVVGDAANSGCDLPVMEPIRNVTRSSYAVGRGKTGRLDTSFHGRIDVQAGATLLVPPGLYRVGRMQLGYGAIIEVDTSASGVTDSVFEGVEFRVAGPIDFLDGSSIRYSGLSDSLAAGRFALYVEGDATFGSDASLRVQLVVRKSVKIGNGSFLQGRVLARDIKWGNRSQGVFAASAFPLSSALVHDVSVHGPRRFWTRDTAVPVAWSIDGIPQTTQNMESLPREGIQWIHRSFGRRADSVLALVDRTPPKVSILSPVAGTILTSATIPVVCSVDGVVHTDTAMLQSGPNSLVRSFPDSAGNTTSVSVQVIADLVPPTVRNASGQNPIEIPFEQKILRLEWFVSDDLAVVGLDVNGSKIWAGEGKAGLEIRPSVGENRYVLTASDPGGRTARDTVLVVRDQDRIAPRLMPLSGHGSQSVTRKDDFFQLVWKVTENDTVISAKVNGLSVMFGNGRIESLQRLQVGRNVFVGEATDRSGNTGRDTVVIQWNPDNRPPYIDHRPGLGSRSVPFESEGNYVVWDVYDLVKLGEVTINGAQPATKFLKMPGSDPRIEVWTFPIMPPLQVGPNVFVLEARDAERNVSRDTVILTRLADRIAPRANPDQTFGSRTVASDQTIVRLVWMVSDNDSVLSARIDGMEAKIVGSRVDWYVMPAYGRNEYVIEVTDRTGNVGRDTMVMERSLDTLPPWITNRPGLGSRTVAFDSTMVLVAWDVMDELGVASVSINGRPSTTGVCKKANSRTTCRTWMHAIMPTIKPGDNVHVLEARDLSGNISRDTVVITRMAAPAEGLSPARLNPSPLQ